MHFFSLAVCLMCLSFAAETYAAKKEKVAVVKTPFGEIVWRFFPSQAPGHTAYVMELINKGFYDGTTFHRVIPHFVIQGGDPNSKNADRSDDGGGDADKTLKAEFSKTIHYRPGTVGMARGDEPDSGSCQFFIALENIPRLDEKYTIFGELTSGLNIARKISEVPRDLNDNPLQPIPVTIRLEERKVPEKVLSLEAPDVSGETLTGPGRRPRAFDPKNNLWKAPGMKAAVAVETSAAPTRIELAVDEQGKVIDVRFPKLDTPDAAKLRAQALTWIFQPATYNGNPQRVRFEIDSRGLNISAPTGGGVPVDVGEGITPPSAVVRVDVLAGTLLPKETPRLRLTIDPDGNVTDVALQSSCGNPVLDGAAVEAAKKLAFNPATEMTPDSKEPEPVAVYLDMETRFVQAESK